MCLTAGFFYCEQGTGQIQKVRDSKMLLSDKAEKLKTTLRDMKHAVEKFTMEIEVCYSKNQGFLQV